MLSHAVIVSPKIKVEAVRDKSDDKIIECAIASEADYIVTSDPDLLMLKQYHSVKIITPKEFLNIKLF